MRPTSPDLLTDPEEVKRLIRQPPLGDTSHHQGHRCTHAGRHHVGGSERSTQFDELRPVRDELRGDIEQLNPVRDGR